MPGELILIVEDNEKNLKLVRDLLQFRGYRTLEAGNAEDGISLATQHLPDLILMDIQLPDMDGGAALGKLMHPLLRQSGGQALVRLVMGRTGLPVEKINHHRCRGIVGGQTVD